MLVQEVQEQVVWALAQLVGIELADLLHELEEAGPEWPYDSVVLAELLVALEAELGISVPMDARTAQSLRSVSGLSERIAEVIEEGRAAT